MLKRLFQSNQNSLYRPLIDIKVKYPPVTELIAQAERITNSCVHPDQVAVSRNFVMNVARRATENRKYTENDLNTVSILMDHMASSRARKIFSLDVERILLN